MSRGVPTGTRGGLAPQSPSGQNFWEKGAPFKLTWTSHATPPQRSATGGAPRMGAGQEPLLCQAAQGWGRGGTLPWPEAGLAKKAEQAAPGEGKRD